MLTEDENKRFQVLENKIYGLFTHETKEKMTEKEIEEYYKLSQKKLSEVLLEIELHNKK